MTEEKGGTGSDGTKDIDPAVEIGLGENMMAREEGDEIKLQRMSERRSVDGKRRGDL